MVRSWLLAPVLMASILSPSPIQKDEEVIFFPTLGRAVDAGARFDLEVHGWIFEPLEEGVRLAALRQLSAWADLDDLEPGGCLLFPEHARYFLVDNERGKAIPIQLGGTTRELEESSASGHFRTRLTISSDELGAARAPGPDGTSIPFKALTREQDTRAFPGQIRLIEASGISVVSDVDDTIKVSQVRDRKALMLNTFCRPFRAVAGMAEVYRRWSAGGARFHYVSGSPWQLYPHLENFRRDSGFPAGTFDLKDFRWKDETARNLITPADEHKLRAIGRLVERFPERKLVLVGDSGERDPEIYAEAARRHARAVIRILIRNVSDEGREAGRYQKVFAGLPAGLWDIFDEPASIQGSVPGL